MARICIIGAGSVVFTQQFLNDLLQVPALSGSTVVLMGPTLSKLEKVKLWADKVCQHNELSVAIEISDDRRSALTAADYVINTLKIGGDISRLDKEIPKKYGVDQAIGDSLGPGGAFRAARTIPVIMDLLADMKEVCPRALLLNYSNPMAMVCLAIGSQNDIVFSGMCHGIQTTLGLIANFCHVPKNEIAFRCAGINHMAWFLSIRHNGRDLYPTLRENIEKPEYIISDSVRCECIRHFGYMMTESSEHLSEYLPWFRKRTDLMEQFFSQASFGRSRGEVQSEEGKKLLNNPLDLLAMEDGSLKPRSDEYCSHVIEAMETGAPFQFNGNIINRGWIDNLPAGACVEVPITVDQDGLHPQAIGALPPQLAALNQSNISMQQLGAEAALTGDPELLYAAVAMDPLCQAVCSLEETRAMVCELYEANRAWLPQFEGKELKPLPRIHIPADTEPVPTPIDPAMAISHRIARLFH